jgi:predicted HicB family RNase H-like nuclease
MDLSPYLESLRRDLTATAAPGGPEISRAADLLAGSLEAAARLCLLEALSDAAAEITTRLESASVEVRLRGREADLVVTEMAATPAQSGPPPTTAADGGDVARITLRLPEPLKDLVEQAAAADGISVNAWLVRAVTAAVTGGPPGPPPRDRHRAGRRITGFAQA